MNAQRLIAQRRKKDEEDITAYTADKRAATYEFCLQNGGHFFGDWNHGGFHPVFQVASYEERVCGTCGYRALRQPVYDGLTARVVSRPENNIMLVNVNGPIIDMESED